MNRMETKQLTDNAIIAEFMGYTKREGSYLYNEPGQSLYVADVRDFAYHNRWDWLMPVVAKITPIAKGMSQQAWFDVKYHLIDADIKVVYDHVVRFIKWYSNQPQKAS